MGEKSWVWDHEFDFSFFQYSRPCLSLIMKKDFRNTGLAQIIKVIEFVFGIVYVHLLLLISKWNLYLTPFLVRNDRVWLGDWNGGNNCSEEHAHVIKRTHKAKGFRTLWTHMIMAGYEAVNSSLWKNTDMYLSDQIKGITSLYLLSVSHRDHWL